MFLTYKQMHRISMDSLCIICHLIINKLKSLKVAQVKDEMDDDEDDGCDVVM